MHRPLLLILLLVATLLPLRAAAEEDATAGEASLGQLQAELQRELAGLRSMDAHIAIAPERLRDPLLQTRDEVIAQVLQDMGRLASALAALPEDDPQRVEAADRLSEQYLAVGRVMLERVRSLSQQMDQQTAELPQLSGAAYLTAESRIQVLRARRFRYIELLVKIYTRATKLGYPNTELKTSLLPLLNIDAEVLSGRIQLTGSMLRNLRTRQSLGTDTTDLDKALGELTRQQRADLDNLRSMVMLLEQFGENSSDYRALLAQYGKGLSLVTLDQAAVEKLLGKYWAGLREAVVKNVPDLVLNILLIIVIFLLFRALARLSKRAVRAACDRPGVNMSNLLKDVLQSVTGGTVMLLGLLVILSQLGISLGPMLAGLGVAGFIVGFALQDTLSNFAAGGMILLYRPYDVDDFVEVAGASGFVKKMSLVSTTITTFDNQTLVIPNSKIWGDVIKNVTAQKVRRVDLVFGISYRDDIEHAERILSAVLEEHDKVLPKPEWKVKLHKLGDSSVDFVVRPWVRTEDYWDVYWDITREVKLRFDREGISIPFPQRDVHLYQN